mmetsp:Transcript_41450/g.65708  ORF Transcript_41450/g.65708 Transcript_41450/m.65708 type:complete len:799 (+) Transcript_41450:127-2523(+)
MIGGAQMMYQHSATQIAPGATGLVAGGLGAAAWPGPRLYQPTAPTAMMGGYGKSLAPPSLPSREVGAPLRASSVLPGMAQPGRPDAVMPSYAPVAHRRNDWTASGPSLCSHDSGRVEKPIMASSNSQGAIAMTSGTGPSASIGSASLSLGGDRKSGLTSGDSRNGGNSMWPHSPEPRMRAPWPGAVVNPASTNPPKPPSNLGPVREGGASLGGILAGDKPPWSSVAISQESHSSARCRSGVNGGSGNYAIAHGDVSGESSGAAKVVRQISMPSSRHELPSAQATLNGGPTLPGPPRHLSPNVFGQEMPPSNANAGAEMMSGRPPPQVTVSYSARAGNQIRPGQAYSFHSEAPSSGRSPARIRPTVQVTGNRSPARTRPLQQPVLWCDGQAFPLGTHSPPYQPTAPLPVPLVVDSMEGDSSSVLAGIYPGSASYPPPLVQGSDNSPSLLVAGAMPMPVVAERELTLQDHATTGQNMSWQEIERERTADDDAIDMELFGPGMNSQDILEDAPEPMAKGQLTDEERLGYQELQFIENLGSGEFGQVFRGFCRGQEVAIKQLYWDNNIAPEVTIADLTREIESFRHLRHKRLVSFIGACLEVPNLCLVTEYMPGGSLHHLLHVRKLKLPLLHCINMCLQLADGVLYLHSQNPVVVHRDLKSLNVVLDLTLNLKLCDFGLTESMDRTHITKKNNGGSPRYMAPELFDNKSKITEKVDIWSMGCIFTEIFGGPLPYEGINTLADLTREMLVHRRMPQIPSHLPDPIQNVIRSCYNFDARLRPTAKQVFDQLKDTKKRLRSQGLI